MLTFECVASQSTFQGQKNFLFLVSQIEDLIWKSESFFRWDSCHQETSSANVCSSAGYCSEAI